MDSRVIMRVIKNISVVVWMLLWIETHYILDVSTHATNIPSSFLIATSLNNIANKPFIPPPKFVSR